jgi:hypothetical protein
MTSAIGSGPNLVYTVNSGIGSAAGGFGALEGFSADMAGLTCSHPTNHSITAAAMNAMHPRIPPW